MSVCASAVYTPHTANFSPDGSRITPSSTSAHHDSDSQQLLPDEAGDKNDNNDAGTREGPLDEDYEDKTYAITPHRLRSQLLIHNLKASGILSHRADKMGRPPQLRHSARGLEAIGFDEYRSMYSTYRGEENLRMDDKEKKVGGGGKRRFLKRLVGRGEEKGERL